VHSKKGADTVRVLLSQIEAPAAFDLIPDASLLDLKT
jgi:hypothetical protein